MLHDRIKEGRLSASLTQEELAKALNIGKRTLIDYENGASEPKVSTAIDVAEKCNIDEWWLLTGKGTMKPETPHEGTADAITAPLVSHHAQAGKGNDTSGIRYEVVETMTISKNLFKTQPLSTVRIIKVEGYSMAPMLYPDSFVIFEECTQFGADGLYIISYSDHLMVKLLQIDPAGRLHIKSINPDYESWTIENGDQSFMSIIGKVLRVVF